MVTFYSLTFLIERLENFSPALGTPVQDLFGNSYFSGDPAALSLRSEPLPALGARAQLQFGVRDVAKTEPILQQIVHGIGEGRPFPLQYKVDNKEFLIKELRVDDGALTVVLAPLKPAALATCANGSLAASANNCFARSTRATPSIRTSQPGGHQYAILPLIDGRPPPSQTSNRPASHSTPGFARQISLSPACRNPTLTTTSSR